MHSILAVVALNSLEANHVARAATTENGSLLGWQPNTLESVLLGFALGMLGTLITSAILDWRRTRAEKLRVREGIRFETEEVRLTLVANAHTLGKTLGLIDHSFVQWVLHHTNLYSGPTDTQPLIEYYTKRRDWSDERLLEEQRQLNASESSGVKETSMRRLWAPFLTASFGSLRLFPDEYRSTVLRLAKLLQWIDEITEQTAEYHYLTFTGLEPGNQHLLLTNQAANREWRFRWAREAADMILELHQARW